MRKPIANELVTGGPSGLTSWLVVASDPSGVLLQPAGTTAYHIDGIHAWLNGTGTANGWIPLSSLVSPPPIDWEDRFRIETIQRMGSDDYDFLFDNFRRGVNTAGFPPALGQSAEITRDNTDSAMVVGNHGASGYYLLSYDPLGPASPLSALKLRSYVKAQFDPNVQCLSYWMNNTDSFGVGFATLPSIGNHLYVVHGAPATWVAGQVIDTGIVATGTGYHDCYLEFVRGGEFRWKLDALAWSNLVPFSNFSGKNMFWAMRTIGNYSNPGGRLKRLAVALVD